MNRPMMFLFLSAHPKRAIPLVSAFLVLSSIPSAHCFELDDFPLSVESELSTSQSETPVAQTSGRRANLEAVRRLSRLIRKQPERVDLLLERATAYDILGQARKAEQDCRAALELEPNNAPALERLAAIYERDPKKVDRAEALYRKALKLTNDPQRRAEYERAAKILASRKRSPEQSPVLLWKSAVELVRKERFSEAERVFSKIIERFPMFHQAYFGRGRLRYEQERYEEALADLKTGVFLSPMFPHGFVMEGLAWEAVGNDKAALRSLQRAMEYEPDDPLGVYHLGRMFAKLGENHMARFLLEKSLTLRPKPPLRRDIRGVLNSLPPDRRAGRGSSDSVSPWGDAVW